ncbi:cytochrome P450 [Streptomyces sioyaensis]|uniref:cytochrome P450 n=1 Tax=Streptomyces sioyaensis TaxID=67364 RepID=UPI0033FF66B6
MTDTIALHSAERAADDGVPLADLTEAGLTHTPIQQSMGLARIHGPVYARKFGEHRTLFVSSLDLVTEVADESRFRKGVSVVLENVREFAGDGLFTAYNDEPNWAKAHEVLMPAFALGSMRTYHPAMLKVARRVMASWDRRAADGTTVQVAEDMTRMTLDTIGLAGFGFDFESFSRGDTPHPFVEAMVRCLEWSMTKFSRDPAADHSAADAAFRADADYLASVVDEVIAARTAGGESGDDDLLGLMLGARDQGDEAADGPTLDLANIRNQVITFLIAGHETTSGALSFALYHLLKDPLALRMVQREADELWGDQADPDPSFEDIGRLPFTRQVLNEALRLWPTAAAFTRQAREDTLLGGRYPVQAGELVTVLTPMLHRDPAWGDNPELFDPSRFSPEAEAARSPHAYKPFGTGERACIGRQFALHEATMLLALLAHRYRLLDHAGYQLRIKETLTLKPDGFTLTLAARTPADRAAVRTALAVLPGGGTGTEDGAATDDGLPTRVPQGTGLLVLHGSNYGTCREFAERLADEATGLGFAPDVAPLDAAAGALPADRPVVIVAASYNGRPTDDAAAFVQWLNTAQDGAAAAVPFAVLGVGDRNWAATYQHIPTLIDDRLDALGAHRLLPRAEADASGDLGGTVKEFTAALRTQLLTRYGDPATIGAAAQSAAEDTGYTVTEITGGPLDALAARHDLVPMTVTEAYDLTAEDWPRPKRFLRIALPDGVGYRTADHLAVLPANAPATVERAARALGADPETVLALHTAGRAARDTLPLDRPVTVRQLLMHHLELGLQPTSEQVAVLAAHNPCPPERLALESLAEDDPRTLIELIEAHPALRGALPWPTVLELLPPLRIRHYSLSSSPASDARHADLMVSLLPGGTGSTHLHALRPGDTVLARVQPCREAFRLDPAEDTPVILVAAGTGLAPFRGAVADRLAAGQTAPARLYFGCDDPDGDFLHAAEFAAAEAAGVISVRPVFSARPEHGHRFVQHRIAAEAAEVWELLQAGARVYVCGDGSRMAPGVRAAFRELHGAQTGASAQESEAWLRELTASGRYIEDVYAAG